MARRTPYCPVIALFCAVCLMGCGARETLTHFQAQQMDAAEELYTTEILVFGEGTKQSPASYRASGRILQASLSPNEKYVAVTVERDGTTDAAVLDLARGEFSPLTETPRSNEFYPTWAPNGRSILFFRTTGAGLRDSSPYLHTLSSGAETRLLSETRVYCDPSLSPDGERLLYVTPTDEHGYSFQIRLFDLAARAELDISESSAFMTQGRWSPDGNKIVTRGNRFGLGDIYIYDLNTRSWKQITDDPREDSYPSWAPDGASIIFSSDRNGSFDIYRYWFAGSRLERLTNTEDVDEISPHLYRDGQTIMCVAVHDARSDQNYNYSPATQLEHAFQVGRYTEHLTGQSPPWAGMFAWRQENSLGTMLLGKHGELIGAQDSVVSTGLTCLHLVKDDGRFKLIVRTDFGFRPYAELENSGEVSVTDWNTGTARQSALRSYSPWPNRGPDGMIRPLNWHQVVYPEDALEIPDHRGATVGEEVWAIELMDSTAFYLPKEGIVQAGTIIRIVRSGKSLSLFRTTSTGNLPLAEVGPSLIYVSLEPQTNTQEVRYWDFVDRNGHPTVPNRGDFVILSTHLNPKKVHPDGIIEFPGRKIYD